IDARVQGEGQAGPKPDEQDEVQAGPNPGDATTSQPQSSPVVHAGPNLEHMDLEVQENLKVTVEEQVILVEPARSTRTLSSLQQLTKDIIFGDLFFNDKPLEANNEKTTAETKAESIPLQATSTETTTTTTTTTTTIHPPPPQPQQCTTNSMLMKRIGELEHIMVNLIQDNKHLDKRLDSHRARLYTLENLDIPQQIFFTKKIWETNSHKTHEDHMMLYEALEKSMNRDHSEEILKDLAEARRKKKKRRDLPKTSLGSPPHQPPPPLPPAGPSGTSGSPGAFGSSQVPPPPPLSPSTNQEDLQMDDDMALDAQVYFFDDEDIKNAHIPKASALASTYSPPPKDLLLAQTDLKYLRYGSKGSRPALSISKIKAAYYPDVGLEQMVLGQMWIEEECKYDIAVIAVRTHMWILSVVRIDVFSMYGYDYMKKIDAMGFEYKHDYMVIDSPRAVTFRDRYEVQMIMRFNEICKFSDDTVHQIDEALDYQVKEFKSPEPPTTPRQEDSHYCSQLMDQTLGYQITRKRLPARD
nr:hypothetical protein [Tanacetum cinerariifolium]